jgi:hypothetical protein
LERVEKNKNFCVAFFICYLLSVICYLGSIILLFIEGERRMRRWLFGLALLFVSSGIAFCDDVPWTGSISISNGSDYIIKEVLLKLFFETADGKREEVEVSFTCDFKKGISLAVNMYKELAKLSKHDLISSEKVFYSRIQAKLIDAQGRKDMDKGLAVRNFEYGDMSITGDSVNSQVTILNYIDENIPDIGGIPIPPQGSILIGWEHYGHIYGFGSVTWAKLKNWWWEKNHKDEMEKRKREAEKLIEKYRKS